MKLYLKTGDMKSLIVNEHGEPLEHLLGVSFEQIERDPGPWLYANIRVLIGTEKSEPLASGKKNAD